MLDACVSNLCMAPSHFFSCVNLCNNGRLTWIFFFSHKLLPIMFKLLRFQNSKLSCNWYCEYNFFLILFIRCNVSLNKRFNNSSEHTMTKTFLFYFVTDWCFLVPTLDSHFINIFSSTISLSTALNWFT